MSAPTTASAGTLGTTAGAQAAQDGLMILLARELAQAWGMLDVHDMKTTVPAFQAAVTLLVQKYGKASMGLASKFYLQQRRAAGIPGGIRVSMADPATHDIVKTALDDALSGLWNIAPAHPVSPFTASTVTDPQQIQDLTEAARVQVQGAAEKLAQDPARQTVIRTVHADPKASGWARIPEPAASPSGTCAFCAMLATRGAVYKSERSAAFEAHPGCVLPGSVVFGPDSRAGFRRHYEGEVVTLVTAAGHELSITPNHPVLTDRGWIPAGLLEQGDYLVSSVSSDGHFASGPDENHGPARIEDLVGALGVMPTATLKSMPGAAEQFHGDGFASEVHVISTYNFLGHKGHPALIEPLTKLYFAGAATPSAFGSAQCSPLGTAELLEIRAWNAAFSSMGGLREGAPLGRRKSGHSESRGLALATDGQTRFTQPASDYATSDTVMQRHCLHGLSHGITDGEIVGSGYPSRIGVPRKFNPPEFDRNPKTLGTFAELGRDLRERLAGSVHLDRLIDKRSWQYQGEVLNLETMEGWYTANGITVSNCKCHPEPLFKGQLYVPSGQILDWQQTYAEATKGRSGADARAAFRQAIEGRPVTGLTTKPAATTTR